MTIYEELGVKTYINAAGTYTVYGGSRMSESTAQRMCEASQNFVEIAELQDRIFEKVAALCKNESAYITVGAAAGIYLSVAASIALKENKPFEYIPQDVVSNYEVMIYSAHKNPYYYGLKQLGVKIIEIGYPNEMQIAREEEICHRVNSRTACFLFFYQETGWVAKGGLDYLQTLRICQKLHLPLIVDAAAQVPPVSNLWRFTDAECVLFSGGKDLKGPQATGLMLGKKLFMDTVRRTAFPQYGIGRILKVGREELVALYCALKEYVQSDEKKRIEWSELYVQDLVKRFNGGIFTVERSYPNEAGQSMPRALFTINEGEWDSNKIQEKFKKRKVGILINTEGGRKFYINPMCLKEQEAAEVIIAIEELL